MSHAPSPIRSPYESRERPASAIDFMHTPHPYGGPQHDPMMDPHGWGAYPMGGPLAPMPPMAPMASPPSMHIPRPVSRRLAPAYPPMPPQQQQMQGGLQVFGSGAFQHLQTTVQQESSLAALGGVQTQQGSPIHQLAATASPVCTSAAPSTVASERSSPTPQLQLSSARALSARGSPSPVPHSHTHAAAGMGSPAPPSPAPSSWHHSAGAATPPFVPLSKLASLSPSSHHQSPYAQHMQAQQAQAQQAQTHALTNPHTARELQFSQFQPTASLFNPLGQPPSPYGQPYLQQHQQQPYPQQQMYPQQQQQQPRTQLDQTDLQTLSALSALANWNGLGGLSSLGQPVPQTDSLLTSNSSSPSVASSASSSASSSTLSAAAPTWSQWNTAFSSPSTSSLSGFVAPLNIEPTIAQQLQVQGGQGGQGQDAAVSRLSADLQNLDLHASGAKSQNQAEPESAAC